MKKDKAPLKTSSKMVLFGGYITVLSTLIFWAIYFLSENNRVTNDFQNSVFVIFVSIIMILMAFGTLSFGLGLMLSRNLAKFVLGFYIFVPFLFWYVLTFLASSVLSSAEYIGTVENLGLFLSTFLGLNSYAYVPLLFSVLVQPRSQYLIILSVSSLLVSTVALFLGFDFIDILGSRLGGINSTDIIYSLVQLPFLLFVFEVARRERLKAV